MIKKENKILLLIKNPIDDKFEISYAEDFLIKEVKEIIIILTLLDIKICLKFYVSLIRKAL